ncbi:T9SS type A sorting domain-containing protein [Cyclobacterium roseum]|uniref:T9SS type A sorting domain-containing protein n=1 Tax=Cyclobacterium roseum TaxID=2666137 RepID=UPI0013916E66|nr:T9SS type A sorting domain-containing protein [Cyclobacterium roseum]
MKKSYHILSFIFLLIMLPTVMVYSQNEIPDNKGKEFWLMFNRNIDNLGINLDLFISGETATSGQVILPNSTVLNFSVTPGVVTTVDIPSSLIAVLADGIDNRGIHIIAEDEITVYGLNQRRASTDAFLALPTDILGNEYIIASYTTWGSGNTLSSVIGVVATMDNTVVTITPASNTNNRQAGVPYQLTLQMGETYQLAAGIVGSDLTGSIVSSNKPVAVFSGHTCSNVPQNTTYCDHLIEQIPPANSLGESFVTVPLASRRAGDIFRIIATKDGTNVTVNGTNGYSENFSLNGGEFKELDIPSDVYSRIVSDQAILVAQYSKGQTSDNVISDPFMMLIPPFEQFQNSYTVSTPATGFNKHFINLAVPISQKGQIVLDGSLLPASIFTDIPGSTFAGAQVEVSEGTHNLSGNLAFGSFMYGFGSYDSYGYPGGQALARVEQVRNINLDLEQEIQQGTTYCFNSTVTDDNGAPIFGVRVDFEVQGPNGKVGFAVTNNEGIANFCLDAVNEGTDKIVASVGITTAEATIVTSFPRPETVLLTPLPETITIGEELCLTSQVLDQFGNPIEGEELFIEYMNTVLYNAQSDEEGKIFYCFEPEDGGDLEFSSYFDGGEKAETIVSVAIPAPIPSSVGLTPSANEVNAGQQICVTATIRDQYGEVMEGVEVQLEINGEPAGSEITDENGVAEFCKTAEGEDGEVIEFSANYIGGTPAITSVNVVVSGGGGNGGNGGGGVLIASSISFTDLITEVTLGSEACVQALVLDQNGDPLPNTEVFITLNGAIVATLTSNDEGIVEYCLITDTLGELAFSATYEGGVPAVGTINVTQVLLIPTTISVNPTSKIIIPGEEVCMEVQVLDQFDNPLGAIEVFVTKNGEPSGSVITDEQGMLTYCNLLEDLGEFEYSFYYSSDNTVTATISVLDQTPVPTIITFVDNEVEGMIGEKVCLAATILDQFGIPLAGVEVSFDVNGVFYGKAITDENGRVEFCQTLEQEATLAITAYFEGGEEENATISIVSENQELKIESFWLVDALTNTIIREIKDGDIIPYSLVKDKSVNFMVMTDPEKVGSVKLEMESLTQCPDCPVSTSGRTENVVPYALFGDTNGDYLGKTIAPGSFRFSATPYEMKNLSGNQGSEQAVDFEVLFDGTVEKFTLVNATDHSDITEIKDGDVVDLSSFYGKKFNIRASVPDGQEGGLEMSIDGPVTFARFEKLAPFAIFGDNGGDYLGKDLPEGMYTLSVTAFPTTSSTNTGIGGEEVTIHFEVIRNIKVGELTLVDADTDKDIMPLTEGSYIDLNQFKNVRLNIRADGKGNGISSMTFHLTGPISHSSTERVLPYALFGDYPAGNYSGKYLPEGEYQLVVTPYGGDNMKGEMLTINFKAGFNHGDNLRLNTLNVNQRESEAAENGAGRIDQLEDLKVYPQPSQDFVNILYPSFLKENARVMIYEGNGRLIHGSQIANTPGFNFGSFGSGLYLIQVIDSNKILTKKVFIY